MDNKTKFSKAQANAEKLIRKHVTDRTEREALLRQLQTKDFDIRVVRSTETELTDAVKTDLQKVLGDKGMVLIEDPI